MLMFLVSVGEDDGIIILVDGMVVEEIIEGDEENTWLRPVTSWP